MNHRHGLIAVFLLAAIPANAQLYWRTDGTSGTWTGANWSNPASATGGTGWTADSNAIFNENSTLTFESTQIGNLTVAAGKTATITAAGTLGTSGNVRSFDIGTGAVLNWVSQDFSTASGTGFIKNGAGTWNMGANGNAYPGGFTLNAGTVVVTGAKAFGSGAMTINGGTIESSDGNSFTPASLLIGGDFAFNKTGSSTATDTWGMPVNLNNGVRTISQNATGAERVFSNVISNGGLTKSGSGTLTLSGANDYSGKTTVSQGILKLSGGGSIAASSGIEIASGAELDVSGLSGWTVASGQKLSGAGTVKGSATVNGRHAPAGTQAVTGNLAYGGASIFEWDFNANSVSTGFDTISRTADGGSVTIASEAKIAIILGGALDFADNFWSVARTWTWASIFPHFSTVGAFTNHTVTGAPPMSKGRFSVDSGGVQWSPALIPEPTGALAGLLLTAGMLRRRR